MRKNDGIHHIVVMDVTMYNNTLLESVGVSKTGNKKLFYKVHVLRALKQLQLESGFYWCVAATNYFLFTTSETLNVAISLRE